jgi:hypothetical protein
MRNQRNLAGDLVRGGRRPGNESSCILEVREHQGKSEAVMPAAARPVICKRSLGSD